MQLEELHPPQRTAHRQYIERLSSGHAFLVPTGKSLEEQGVKHNVKAMVLELKQSEEDARKNFQDEEEEQNEAKLKEKRIQRTKRGLEILAERGTRRPGLVASVK